MRELIERVEKLTGPDPHVDSLIAAHFRLKQLTGKWPDWLIDPPFTESIDAAVALVERVRPGWHWYVDDRSAAVWPDGVYDESAVQAATPAIALVLALLKSLPSQEERG